MKTLFRQSYESKQPIETALTPPNLKESIERTRQDLDRAYAGFDNAIDIDMIDSYIYEINSLQKRYKYLSTLVETENEDVSEKKKLYQHSPIRSLVSHVLG